MEPQTKQNTGKKIGYGLLGGCGLAVLAFIIVTVCTALAFPFLITMDGSYYMESAFAMNLIFPPICGALVAPVAAIVGFAFLYRRTK